MPCLCCEPFPCTPHQGTSHPEDTVTHWALHTWSVSWFLHGCNATDTSCTKDETNCPICDSPGCYFAVIRISHFKAMNNPQAGTCKHTVAAHYKSQYPWYDCMCVCPAAIPTLCLLLQCSLLEVLTQQSQLQLHRQITSKPRNRLCKRSNFLQHKKLSLRGKLPGSFAHPFFPLFSFPKCRSWKGIHSSGMSTGIYSFQFVSQMTKCYWLNLHLLALPGPLSDTQVYKVISSSFYKSRFMSLSLLFSMKWLCRFFPFIPLSHLDYFYSPPLSHLRNFTSLSGSPCRRTLYSPAPIQTTILTPTR